MLFVYPAIFHKEDESYWVEFPDLKGCNTYGSTIPEAMEMAQEALTGYLLSLLEHGDNIASPSDINQYKDTKAVKKTLTIPSWLNDRAISMGINFSQALQEALLSKIQA